VLEITQWHLPPKTPLSTCCCLNPSLWRTLKNGRIAFGIIEWKKLANDKEIPGTFPKKYSGKKTVSYFERDFLEPAKTRGFYDWLFQGKKLEVGIKTPSSGNPRSKLRGIASLKGILTQS
jgi:hypothetical protein